MSAGEKYGILAAVVFGSLVGAALVGVLVYLLAKKAGLGAGSHAPVAPSYEGGATTATTKKGSSKKSNSTCKVEDLDDAGAAEPPKDAQDAGKSLDEVRIRKSSGTAGLKMEEDETAVQIAIQMAHDLEQKEEEAPSGKHLDKAPSGKNLQKQRSGKGSGRF